MDSTVSVSKGCFVFKNGLKISAKKQKKKEFDVSPLFDQNFTTETWYSTFKSTWNNIENKIQSLNTATYDQTLKDLVKYVKDCYNDESSISFVEIIPCATLLTGINQPDHTTQFVALKDQLLDEVTSHVAILYSQDSATIKHVVENMVSQFINTSVENLSDYEDCTNNEVKSNHLKKSHCTMSVLKAWFQDLYVPKKSAEKSPLKRLKSKDITHHLVVIIPDFENFNSDTLQDLILILSGYTHILPFVLIFGVATSVSALHKSFPYHVSSKLYIQVFQSHSSTTYLNKILDEVFLSEDCPFHLGDKPFKLLMDVFLFYDFSVTGFIQGIKFCMMEHYYNNKIMSLCCSKKRIKTVISELTDDDLEKVRHLPSFRPYVESKPATARISLLLENDYFRTELASALKDFHNYLYNFHLSLKILLIFISELPNSPLGKQLRELYSLCISFPIVESSEYKQCIKLLDFQSKEDIIRILKKCVVLLNSVLNKSATINSELSSTVKKKNRALKILFNEIRENILTHLKAIELASFTSNVDNHDKKIKEDVSETFDRRQLKEIILKATRAEKSLSEYDIAKKCLLEYISNNIFEKFLKPAQSQPFYEIFFFNDIYKVKKNIVGTPRAAIHTALMNPVSYLQCDCCILPREEMILSTLPDLSIVYKLYLECGKLINLYDWLQAFLTIVDPIDESENNDEERRDIDPQIQARFTRAVSELQFLGFIKTSKRKTDHVTRLTW